MSSGLVNHGGNVSQPSKRFLQAKGVTARRDGHILTNKETKDVDCKDYIFIHSHSDDNK